MAEVVEGLDELDHVLNLAGKSLQQMDFTDELKDTANDFRTLHAGYFENQVSPSGVSWPEWMWKRRGASWDHKTLDDTGRLKQSLQSGPDHIEEISPHEMVWGTSVPYSHNHQFGGTFITTELLITRRGGRRPAGSPITLPAREHVGIDEVAVDRIAERIADAVLAQFMPDHK